MNLAELLDRSAIFFPENEALIDGDRVWTYEDFLRDANRCAHALESLGVGPGDRVGLFMSNRAEFCVAFYGIAKMGAIATSLPATFKKDELEWLLNDCGASVVITDTEHAGGLPERSAVPSVSHAVVVGDGFWELLEGRSGVYVTAGTDRDDGIEIIYTGGTTGFPKGVVLTHANVLSNCYTNKAITRLEPRDRCLCFLPMYHSFAQNHIFNQTVCAGATLVILPKFDLETVVDTMRRRRVTRWLAVPTIYMLILNAEDREAVDEAFSEVTHSFSAAAAMPAEVARRWHERFGLDIYEGFGLTESSPSALYNHEYRHKAGSVGTPLDNVEVRIWDADERPLPPGQVGEIVISGPNVMKGYYNNPEATAEVLRDGWLKTGDVGRMDEEGYFYLVDRKKDMVNSAGLKIWPREVEEVLFTHEAVAECAVIGVPDPLYGESVMACVVARRDTEVSAEDLIGLCKERLAGYKAPKFVEFLDELPKSAAGKILKHELRDKFSE